MARDETIKLSLIDGVTKSLGQIRDGVSGVGAQLAKLNQVADLAGKAFGLVGSAVSAIGSNVQGVADLELALARVSDITQATTAEQAALQQAVSDAATQVGVTADQAANALLQYYAKDTVGEPIDSLRWVWQQVRTPAARYAEALTYMAQGNYTAANEVVADIPEEHDLKAPEMVERQRMLDLIAFLQGVQLDGRTEAELDSTEVDALEALVADAHDRPAVWAQNLLCYAYDRCRSWPTGGDGMDWRALSAGQNEQPTFEPSGLRINPNPAETWVALNNKLPKAAPTGELRLLDVTGRLLWSRKLADTYGQVVVDTRTWSTGSYTVELRQGERTLATERLLVKN